MLPHLETKCGEVPLPFICQTLASNCAKDFSNFIISTSNVICLYTKHIGKLNRLTIYMKYKVYIDLFIHQIINISLTQCRLLYYQLSVC